MAEDVMKGKKISSITQLRKLDNELREIADYLLCNTDMRYSGLIVNFKDGTVMPYIKEQENDNE